jgi:hypothetical protein
MSDPVFTRTEASAPLYTLPATVPGAPAYAIAFLPATTPKADSLTLAETWSQSPAGIYLFLGQAVANPAAFAASVRQYVGSNPVRFLWIANPADVSSAWTGGQLQVSADGLGSMVVSRAARIDFRGYTLGIGKGCGIALDAGNDGFTVAQVVPGAVFLQTGQGATTLPADGTLAIPFAGDAAGTLQAAIPVPAAQWPVLDACIRFFVDDPGHPGYLRGLPCPVLVPPSGGMTLDAVLDPVNPLLPDRTILRIPTSAGAMATGYRTVLGGTVQLTPTTTASFPTGPGLVFQVAPVTLGANAADPFYLTYHGPFALAASAQKLMCGISGVEYATTSATTGQQVVFYAGQPAYAPAPGVGTRPLTDAGRTAWCSLVPAAADGATYFAQPDSAVFYQAQSGDSLAYLEVPAGYFPVAQVPPGGGTPTVFPWAPYALAASADAPRLRTLEVESVSPARRAALTSFLIPTETGGSAGGRAGTTPQGLLVDFDPALRNWKTVTLARNQGGAEELQLADVVGGLKAALQSDQLFAVVSRPDVFTGACSVVGDFSLTLDGWTFRLDPATWPVHDTIALFKCARRSVWEIANDLSAWSWPEAADGWSASSGSLREVQKSLVDFLADAKRRSTTEPDFGFFVRKVVDNPAWNGVLFLRVDLSGSLPLELAGLAAGIDPSQFMANHVGVTLTPVEVSGGALVPHDSSIFALIAYDDPQDLYYQDKDYAYKVLSLKVLFLNSAVASFSSRIELMINALFGDPCILRGSGHGNNLILEGAYQQAGGQAHYSFVQQGVNRFVMTSATLEAVETLTAQFVTLIPPAGDPGDTVRTEFRLTGDLQYKVIEGFDLFSFGPPPGTETPGEGGLRFSGLVVRMSFPAADPGRQTFAFDAGTLSFDPSSSVARPDSIYSGLPLKLTGLVQSPDGVSPGDLGYMSVAAPVDQAALAPPWYGLAFQLQLGTLGSLAGNAGLSATLSACWAPSQTRAQVYLGLKLPGSSSARPEIPLAGVLSLSFGTIELVVDTSGPALAYMLLLRGIALKLLGISFPPGQTDLYVFGDPTSPRSGNFGWYAAYAADDEDGGGEGGERSAPSGYRTAAPRAPRRLRPVPVPTPPPASGDPGRGCCG